MAAIYDIVLLGATGFTGSLCAEFISKNYPSNLKWSIAGRSMAKLEKLAKDLKVLNPDRLQPEIELVQLTTEELEPLVKRTRLVINGVGPFHRYSTPIVAACAKLGTHYVDFTTETLWVKELTEKYHEMARLSGAILIPAISPCAPSDLVAWLIATEIRKSYSTGTSKIICSGKLDINAMSGGSFTTVLDSVATYGPRWYLGGHSWVLSPKPKVRRIPRRPWMTRIFGHRHIPELGRLTTSFTGPGNESVVHRSAGQSPELYGPNFHFEEYLPVTGFGSALLVHLLTIIGVILVSIPPTRALLRRLSPEVGSGPDVVEARKTERAEFQAVGKADGAEDHFQAQASFVREGALYEFTALLACVGARILLEKTIEFEKQGKDLSGTGGIVTPSSLGMPYVEGLREAGAKIDVRLSN